MRICMQKACAVVIPQDELLWVLSALGVTEPCSCVHYNGYLWNRLNHDYSGWASIDHKREYCKKNYADNNLEQDYGWFSPPFRLDTQVRNSMYQRKYFQKYEKPEFSGKNRLQAVLKIALDASFRNFY